MRRKKRDHTLRGNRFEITRVTLGRSKIKKADGVAALHVNESPPFPQQQQDKLQGSKKISKAIRRE